MKRRRKEESEGREEGINGKEGEMTIFNICKLKFYWRPTILYNILNF